MGQHQEQAQLLSGRRLLQPHPHLPRRHLLNTRSSKSEIEQILAKDVSAGFQQRLQELLRGEGSQDSGTASLLAPLLLLIFAVALQLLAIRSTIPPGAGASDSEGDNSNLRPPCSPILPLRLPGPTNPVQDVWDEPERLSAGAALPLVDRLLSHLPNHHQQWRQPCRPLAGLNTSIRQVQKKLQRFPPNAKLDCKHLLTSDCHMCRK